MRRYCSALALAGLLATAACAGGPPPVLPDIGEEIAFAASDDVVLRGSLLLPAGEGPFPAVVGLVGSGAYSYRDAWVDGHWEFWKELTDELLDQNFAVLLFDKRGVQKSDGTWETRALQQRADDALAAVRFLKGRGEIDPGHIGLAGQSQGGWVAQIGAAAYPEEVAFLITFAGPSIPVLEQVADDRESELRCEGKSEEAIIKKRVRYLRNIERFPRGHLKVIKDYDPRDDLRNIRQPMLAIFAENDELVWAQKNSALLTAAFEDSGNTRLWIHTVSGANHAFLYGERCEPLKGHDGPPTFREALLDPRFFEAIGVASTPQQP